MTEMSVASIREHFRELTNLRRWEPTYLLMDMLVMTVCAVTCEADDFVAIAQFARS